MVRFTRTLVVLAAGIASLAIEAMAQTPIAAPPATDLAGSTTPNPLPGLPRPPDQPASLLTAPAAEPAYEGVELERPYFERDPLLDPADLPHPGWLFDVEVGIMGSHVTESLGQPPFPNGNAVPFKTEVAVPMAPLNWTVSPRFELGYRLPSGFGEVDFSYRFLLADGTGLLPTNPVSNPDAPATLTSHLRMNYGDVDYAACESSLATMLGPGWTMKWRLGLRVADMYFDSRADEPTGAVPPGGFFERSISNDFLGFGPHAGVELGRRRNAWGLGWIGRLDGALLWGHTTQGIAEVSATPADSEFFNVRCPEQVPTLSGFLGIDWRPPCYPNLDILLGYSAEYWWGVGRISDPDLYNGHSAGEVGLNGAMFRLEYNY
ncbi:MAG: Lpg1974 family pore-forming outer membrane protein [Thermoguttaceae bacterium]|jgi:hypothetical protein